MNIFNYKDEDIPRYAILNGNIKCCFCNCNKKKKISKTQSLSCFRIKNKQYSPCPLEHVWEPGQIKTKYVSPGKVISP